MPIMEDINLDDLEETTLIEDGQEEEFMVMSAERIEKKDDMGNISSIRLAFAFVPQVDAPGYIPPVYHAIFLSRPGDEKWKVQSTLRKIDALCRCLNYQPVNGKVDPAELKMQVGRAVFKQVDDNAGGRKNEIKYFVV